jgi:hypothetical protein
LVEKIFDGREKRLDVASLGDVRMRTRDGVFSGIFTEKAGDHVWKIVVQFQWLGGFVPDGDAIVVVAPAPLKRPLARDDD